MGLLSGIPTAALIGAGIALGPVGVIGGAIGGAVTGSWLNKILKKDKQKKDK
jgi:hypothetical protein